MAPEYNSPGAELAALQSRLLTNENILRIMAHMKVVQFLNLII